MAARPAMPGATAFACALVAHGLVAEALVISYGHDHPVADMLAVAAVPVVGLGLASLRRQGPVAAFAGALAWVAALASTVAVLVVDPGVFVDASAPRAPFLVLGVAAIGVVASYALDVAGRPVPGGSWARVLWCSSAWPSGSGPGCCAPRPRPTSTCGPSTSKAPTRCSTGGRSTRREPSTRRTRTRTPARLTRTRTPR